MTRLRRGDVKLNVFFASFRYLMQNMDWLEEELGGYEDDFLIIDCPGTSSSLLI